MKEFSTFQANVPFFVVNWHFRFSSYLVWNSWSLAIISQSVGLIYQVLTLLKTFFSIIFVRNYVPKCGEVLEQPEEIQKLEVNQEWGSGYELWYRRETFCQHSWRLSSTTVNKKLIFESISKNLQEDSPRNQSLEQSKMLVLMLSS